MINLYDVDTYAVTPSKESAKCHHGTHDNTMIGS